jgi:predicted nucleic acid-binding protein
VAWSKRLPAVLPDTSVLVAAFCSWHEHHVAAAAALGAIDRRREMLVLAAPVLLETYAVLTRLPPPHRLSPDSARRLIEGNLARTRIVALDGPRYWLLVRRAADDGIAGGRTYDALVVACAVRARVDRLLTLNRRDFEPIVPDTIRLEVPTA